MMMPADPRSREALLRSLVAIPSITGTDGEEEAARYIFEWFSRLKYFKENPDHLESIEIKSTEGRVTHSVLAFMRAARRTQRTIVMIAHYDVVSTDPYGALKEYAFDPDELAKRIDRTKLSDAAARDLASGDFIFGRGTMDMKAGLAIEMELMRDFDEDRSLIDANLIVLAVPDEENTSSGARAGASRLAQLKREHDLEYVMCVNTEPSEPGMPDASGEMIFMGGLGKMLPSFYCRGVDTHVGNYYHGISAALLSSCIALEAEASPELADPSLGVCHPSWMCLRHETLQDRYSVTIPNRSIIFFNCFVTTKTPADVLDDMHRVARRAADISIEKLRRSHDAISALGYAPGADGLVDIKTMSFAEVFERAASRSGKSVDDVRDFAARHIRARGIGDIREAGYDALEAVINEYGLDAEAPFIAYGFLPPINPPTSSLDGRARNALAAETAKDVVSFARERFGVRMDIAEHFAGLCDLSFMSNGGAAGDVYGDNCLGWGTTYEIPFADIAEIDMPAINIGTRGFDAHRATERLDAKWSFGVLPEILLFALRKLCEKHDEHKK